MTDARNTAGIISFFCRYPLNAITGVRIIRIVPKVCKILPARLAPNMRYDAPINSTPAPKVINICIFSSFIFIRTRYAITEKIPKAMLKRTRELKI